MALARLLADAGWDLTLLAREPTRLDSARTELVARGARVLAQSTDVADMPAVERAMQAAIFAHGVPRLVIAGAGMVVPRPFEVQSLDAFRRTMEVNYFGTLHLARAAVPAMRQAGGGRIVMVASATALLGLYGYTSYAPSKFAVRGLAEALRSELAPDGVAVSVVYPPDTDTPGYREEARTRPDVSSRLAATGGLMTADAVAAAILRGIERKRFVIAPGPSMRILASVHSLVGPLLHRFWFDPLIRRLHRPPSTSTAAKTKRP